MTTAINLEAYLERIRYAGDRAPTLATLATIHVRHTEAIAFENLNPLLGWPVRLDLESLQQKMVRDGRGGYCFEHNILFKHALDALGFCVTGLAARVLWGAAENTVTARTHMLLRVDLDGQPYIVDVGFGGVTLTGPLRLEAEIEQTTPHEPFRLLKANEEFVEQVNIRGNWVSLYRFSLQENLLPDYEVTNWYLSNHPDSRFVTGLLAARPAPDRRYALLNNQFAVHHLNGHTEQRILASADEMRETLESVFHLTLPDTPDLDELLAGLTTRTQSDVRTLSLHDCNE